VGWQFVDKENKNATAHQKSKQEFQKVQGQGETLRRKELAVTSFTQWEIFCAEEFGLLEGGTAGSYHNMPFLPGSRGVG